MRRLVALITLFTLLAAGSAQAAGLATTQRVLAREMARSGCCSGAYVLDLTNERPIYAYKADVARMPASVEKLYTSASALLLYGADGHLTTSVLADRLPDKTGTIAGDVALRGGGDPTFGTASAADLARQLADAGLTRIEGRVVGDESAFDAFRGPPSEGYRTSGEVGPLSALAFNHGRTGLRAPYFQASPARFAAQQFEKELEKRGVKIVGKAKAGLAATGMTPFSEWESPPVSSIVRQMNQPSDNYYAEMLIKGLGAEFGTAGSTAAGAKVVRDTVGAVRDHAEGRRRLRAEPLRSHHPAPGRLAAEGHGRQRGRGRVRPVAGRDRPQRHRVQPHARHGGPGQVPRQDRHAARRVRARGLLHHRRRRAGSPSPS